MSFENLKNNIVDRMQKLLWGQWGILGIRGSDVEPIGAAIDLEALIFATCVFGRTDPRLFDEALSWTCESRELVNQKRLKGLVDKNGSAELSRVASGWMTHVNRERIRLGNLKEHHHRDPLFLDRTLEEQTVGETHDGIFRDYGLLRGPFEPNPDRKSPDLSNPKLVQLFARRFFGKGARAEVVRLLLHGKPLSTTTIASLGLYTKRSVQETLKTLKETNILNWNPGRGRTTQATFKEHFQQHFLSAAFGQDEINTPRQLKDWGSFYLGFAALWEGVVDITRRRLKGFQAQSVLRDAWEEMHEHQLNNPLEQYPQPRLTHDSFDGLLSSLQTYTERLFDQTLNSN